MSGPGGILRNPLGSGGSGSVSITSPDSSITVAGTTSAPTLEGGAALARTANNGSDFADAGSARLNLHIAELALCQVAATSNITLSGLQTIDGYTTLAGDLVLCTGQSTASQNGPWLAASGAWTRPHEYISGGSIVGGRLAGVVNGTINAHSRWILTTAGTVTVDTTATTWVPSLPSSVAPLASPTFTGTPAGPTPSALDNSTKLATTAYADAAVTAAEALAIPLTQKAAASGVASLTSGSIVVQTPAAHAQALHGRGGTDTLLNGLVISDTGTNQTAHTFQFGPRTTTTLPFPVATMEPNASTALTMALDIAPSVGASNYSNNGLAWIDVCDLSVIDAGATWNAHVLRLANQSTFGEVSTRTFGSAVTMPLYLSSGYTGTGNPQIYMTTHVNKYIVLGDDGSDVLVGGAANLLTTATLGFFSLPCCAGAPTGVPALYITGRAHVIFDSTNSKIWVYAGSWKGVVVA